MENIDKHNEPASVEDIRKIFENGRLEEALAIAKINFAKIVRTIADIENLREADPEAFQRQKGNREALEYERDQLSDLAIEINNKIENI